VIAAHPHPRVPWHAALACAALPAARDACCSACQHVELRAAPVCLQELLSERARLQSEVDALRAATAAEASSSKQELATQRSALEQQQAAVSARIEAVTEGARDITYAAYWELKPRSRHTYFRLLQASSLLLSSCSTSAAAAGTAVLRTSCTAVERKTMLTCACAPCCASPSAAQVRPSCVRRSWSCSCQHAGRQQTWS
jgi:hypothetical protein